MIKRVGLVYEKPTQPLKLKVDNDISDSFDLSDRKY